MKRSFLFLSVLFLVFIFSNNNLQAQETGSNFTDKVIIITGTSSGLGESLAKIAAKKKMKLVLVDINYPPSKKMADEINENGGEAIAIQVDLAKPEERGQIIEKTMKKFGRIDFLINDAAYLYVEKVEDVDLKQAHHCFEVNFWAYLDLVNRVIPIMKRQKEGSIINILSRSSFVVLEGFNIGVYTSTKHALFGLFKTMAFELKNTNINFKIVCPAGMKTNIFKNAVGGGAKKLRETIAPLFLEKAESPDYIAKEIFKKMFQENPIILPGKANQYLNNIKYMDLKNF